MLDFTTQKQLLDPILKNPKNHHCADCDSISPTWASLDFGVFLCSNCSGAHRGLGPTITRVRSANLDKWQEEWLTNMLIGNSELNLYW
jgi:ribosomal protein L37AE/L43A